MSEMRIQISSSTKNVLSTCSVLGSFVSVEKTENDTCLLAEEESREVGGAK